jgi:hypothetical protein
MSNAEERIDKVIREEEQIKNFLYKIYEILNEINKKMEVIKNDIHNKE